MATSSMDIPDSTVRGSNEPRLGALATTALVLAIIGGINWGLVGLFRFDLVAALFGEMSTITRAVYVIVALAALYCITIPFRTRH